MLRVSVLVFGAFCLGISLGGDIKSTKINVKESDTKNLEQVSINVQTTKIEKDKLGNFKDAEIVKVGLD